MVIYFICLRLVTQTEELEWYLHIEDTFAWGLNIDICSNYGNPTVKVQTPSNDKIGTKKHITPEAAG